MSPTPYEGRASRRAVLRTAAWTTPVVAVAVAAPAAAASPAPWPGSGLVNLYERSGGGGYGQSKGLVTDSNAGGGTHVLQSLLVMDKTPPNTQEPPSGTTSGPITYTIFLDGYAAQPTSQWTLGSWILSSETPSMIVLSHASVPMYGSTSQFQIPLTRTESAGHIAVTVTSSIGGSEVTDPVPGSTF